MYVQSLLYQMNFICIKSFKRIRRQYSLYFGQPDFLNRLSELAQTHLWLNGHPYCIRIQSNQFTYR